MTRDDRRFMLYAALVGRREFTFGIMGNRCVSVADEVGREWGTDGLCDIADSLLCKYEERAAREGFDAPEPPPHETRRLEKLPPE